MTRTTQMQRRRGWTPQQDPTIVSWAQFAAATVTGAGFSSVPDFHDAGNPLTQSTDAKRPASTTLNGHVAALLDGSNDALVVPITTPRVASPRWALSLWVLFGTASGDHTIFSVENVVGGASASRMLIMQSGTSLLWDVFVAAFSVRRFTVTGAVQTSTPVHLSFEYDGSQSAEADECSIWLDLAKQSGNYINDTGAPNDMPDVLLQPTGNARFGSRRDSDDLNPFNGKLLNPMMSVGAGGVSGGGVLTAEQRARMRRYQAGVAA